MMATITARVDDDVKLWLKHFSKEIGVSVWSLFNAWAKNLLRTGEVTFRIDPEDQEMYANRRQLQQELEQSVESGHSSLAI